MAENVGIGTEVIGALKKIRGLGGYKAVPITYLTERIGRPTSEIRTALQNFEADGVVVIDGERDEVTLKAS